MKRLSLEKRALIVGLLVEGNSIRATSRLSDVAFNTVLRFVADIGRACTEYQDRTLRNITARRVQADEIWAFCGMKDKNVPEEMRGQPGIGSAEITGRCKAANRHRHDFSACGLRDFQARFSGGTTSFGPNGDP